VRVLVAMSGGVDSSVAAALLRDDGHEVVGATMKLWAGPSDSGCCSVADVEDARRVAEQIGINHHVFNFSAEFDRRVVDPYVADHAAGRTPNPCVECNRYLKFDRFDARARLLGFDAIATGHHARVVAPTPDRPGWALRRGLDAAKDQSYVLHMLDQTQLSRTSALVISPTGRRVRERAVDLGLRTATKPDSQDVCFISRSGGRQAFLTDRIPLRPGTVVDGSGTVVGAVPAIELVTIGQRRALGNPGGTLPPGERRYAVGIDVPAGVVTVGPVEELLVDEVGLEAASWVADRPADGRRVLVQVSAHGAPVPATWWSRSDGGRVALDAPMRRVAPGQSVVLYLGDLVLGGGTAL
jgi:tRNA-specific 2-thiouridylase